MSSLPGLCRPLALSVNHYSLSSINCLSGFSHFSLSIILLFLCQSIQLPPLGLKLHLFFSVVPVEFPLSFMLLCRFLLCCPFYLFLSLFLRHSFHLSLPLYPPLVLFLDHIDRITNLSLSPEPPG